MINTRVKPLVLGCTLAMLTVLSGCAGGTSDNDAASAAQDTPDQVRESVDDTAKDTPADNAGESGEIAEEEFVPDIITVGPDTNEFKVGMVTNTGGIGDQSYNQRAWEGLCTLNRNNLATVSYIETYSTAEYEKDLLKFVEEDYDMIWGIGYQFAYDLEKVARENPDSHFAIVDYAFGDIPENVTCATFKSQESAFLVGYIAAAVSETGKVGFIGGQDVPAIDQFKYGYMAGVAKADKELGTHTEVMTDYVGSFDDLLKGAQLAQSMYESGCDVIFHAAGGAGTGVIRSAEENDKFVIGVDSDQSEVAPENVLTSAMKMIDVAIANISVQYNLNDNIGGRNIEYGLAEHAVGIPEDHPNYSDEIYDAAKELERQIIYNEIVPPSDEAGFEDFKNNL